MTEAIRPLWLDRLDRLVPIASQFVIEGNVDDHQLMTITGKDFLVPLHRAIWEVLRTRGYGFLLRWDAVTQQIELAGGESAAAGSFLDTDLGSVMAWMELGVFAARLMHAPDAVVGALLVDNASRLVLRPDNVDAAEASPLATVQAAAVNATTRRPHGRRAGVYNPVIWLAHQAEDLPAWFLGQTRGLRSLVVEGPDIGTRRRIAVADAARAPGWASADDAGRAEFIDRISDATEGMEVRELTEVVTLMRDRGLTLEDVEDAVTAHRVGLADNPWRRSTLRSRIAAGEESLRERVLGQDAAVALVLDVLKRSATGLTAAHRGGSRGPRGVVFLAGPTGVGKTELAKAVAELVYGSESSIIRFDMSEFSAEQAEARLIGAPPGYVGHGAGGELTNAVRNRPFSVVLFDEVEKASPRILDVFLQLLDDGRLTDSHGRTTDFRESLVMFTSNLGIYRAIETPNGRRREVLVDRTEMSEAEIERIVRTEVRRHFTEVIGRPELLNRIGDNVVVCRFIDEHTAGLILDRMLGTVALRLKEEHDIILDTSPVREQLLAAAIEALDFGGRGVGNVIEARLVNPLARALFEASTMGDHLVVRRIGKDESGVATLDFS